MDSIDSNVAHPLGPISKLSDAELFEIFRHLPLRDRLLVSEVCKRWFGVSRIPWSDIQRLSLSSIPTENVRAITRLCTNVQSIVCSKSTYVLGDLYPLAKSNVKSVSLYSCSFTPRGHPPPNWNYPFSAVFSANLQNVAWTELVLHDVRMAATPLDQWRWRLGITFPSSPPRSLTRLQLTGSTCIGYAVIAFAAFTRTISQLRNLECLILHSTADDHHVGNAQFWKKLAGLRNLRELCLGPATSPFHRPNLAQMAFGFARLDVLFLHGIQFGGQDIIMLLTQHASLRILVLTDASSHPVINGDGNVQIPEIIIPKRTRFPVSSNSTPLPLLHVFLGKMASECLRFTKSPPEALKVYPINEALPNFLQSEEIMPIFRESWIAAKIKEAAKLGPIWCSHSEGDAVSVLYR